jgi:RimJ/RimL family protein N-acetyltransferase
VNDATGELGFRRYVPGQDEDALIAFLTSNHWPFHVRPHPTAEDARKQIADGDYDGRNDRTFWVLVDGEVAGLVRTMDMDHGDDPQVDIRLGEAWRGRGLGRRAVAYLVEQVFAEFGDLQRIEATARRDNVASRRTLRACGFVKEAVYRLAYEPHIASPPPPLPGVTGSPLDSVGYALLRRDRDNGTSTPVDWEEEP